MIIPFIVSLVALLCIYLEFYLPGGILALIGGSLALLGLFLFSQAVPDLFWTGLYLILMCLAAFFVCKLALYRIRTAKPEKSVYLHQDQTGFFASHYDKTLIGKSGEALSDLKPSGHILVEGQSLQALSESGYISKGDRILITAGRGAYYIVTKEDR